MTFLFIRKKLRLPYNRSTFVHESIRTGCQEYDGRTVLGLIWDILIERFPYYPKAVRTMKVPGEVNILLVEDEPILAMDLADRLEEEGYRVVGIASNGRKALELYQTNTVDLVLCDIVVKGDWDGIETARHLLAKRPVPIIYLTATTDRETLERAKHTYPAAYLNKPFHLSSLRNAIELAVHNAAERPVVALASASEITGRDALLQINK